ncbi:fibronectin type III domain-containing protein [Microbulbifer celer]|uniref:Fibronectin type III domain-containing protein n=1 Tax=Microbulbifer celer TaxID=435905 RepID=A0ABW3U883_9GAMM|nr:fibronectin type III domain-containing protein [Microbulbifer celer]UFN57343.1 fibronectin type III domain-containing protein [Microbulbifer celer]
MEPSRWTRSALALCIMGTLTACGGGGTDANNEGDVIATPPAQSGSSSSGGSSGGGSEGGTLHEDFGDGLLVNFDEADTQFFFSQEYKALNTANPEDAWPSFYYPTCCFFANDNPADGPEVALDQMGIVSDAGNPALLLDTGRFTIGQTRPESDDPEDLDPKKDTTTSDDISTWGELDLSDHYRVSFCVKAASGTRNMQVYVDNNTSGEANSIWGGGSQGSRIFNVPAGDLIPGKRVQINVPGDITYEQGGEVKDIRPELVGTAGSFLQLRVEGGSSVILDDLLVEPQAEDGQADLPACNVYQPATAPEAPEAPGLFAGDALLVVSWSEVVGATGYELAYNTEDSIEGATIIPAAEIEGSQHDIEALENDTEYFVFLRVINSVGAGEWSESASGTPIAPEGAACTSTQKVEPSPAHSILWNVYDGCAHPGADMSVVINGSDRTQFDLGDNEKPWFTVSEQGVMTLNTNEPVGEIQPDEETKPVGDLSGIIADPTYPMHFTWIARIDTSLATTKDGVRGFEIETHLADAGIEGRGPARIKAIIRSDKDPGRLQLEKFLPGGETAEVDMNLTDGFHTYQLSFVVKDPAIEGDNYITATVYRDGVEVGSFTGNGREGGSSSSKMRIGEGSSSPFHANVDWIAWSDSQTAAELAAEELVGELPENLGDLGSYSGKLVFKENFNGATDGDSGDSTFFTPDYRALESDNTKPFYFVTGGGSRLVVSDSATDGKFSINDARFTMGDTLAHTEQETSAEDTMGRGEIDLSKPYIITFDVLTNENAEDGDQTGKCQVYVDNNTSSSSKSMHGGDSKIFEELAPVIADGGKATGTVTIESDPDDHVGTDKSFLQLRCDSRTEAPVTIDNFKVTYQ